METTTPHIAILTTATDSNTSSNDTSSHSQHEHPIGRYELEIWGPILLTYFIIFIISNSAFIFLIYKNWRKLRDSPYFCSNLCCLFLAIADLAVAILVGFPAALHMTSPSFFGRQDFVKSYAIISLFLFEYTFIFRIIIVAAITIDKGLHVLWPMKYTFKVMSTTKVVLASSFIILLPMAIRATPNIVYMGRSASSETILHCSRYVDPDVSIFERTTFGENFRVPLTCSILINDQTSNNQYTIFALFELVVLTTITLSAFVIIVVVDIAIIVNLARNKTRVTAPHPEAKRREPNFRFLMIRTLVVTATFIITNLPYVLIWLHDFIINFSPDSRILISARLKFQMILLTFLSLVFHPWLYSLKMKSLRSILPTLKRSLTQSTFVLSIRSLKTRKISDTVKSNENDFVLANPNRTPSPDGPSPNGQNDIVLPTLGTVDV